jgi:hypothetical protein
MEPLTALGLAGNIVQFVDFACKLFEGARTIYKSASSSSDEYAVLHVIATDLSRLSGEIMVSPEHPEGLRCLAAEAESISQELLGALQKLKLQGQKTKWKSFIIALKEAWNRDKVNEIAGRLSALQSQLNMHIQLMVR